MASKTYSFGDMGKFLSGGMVGQQYYCYEAKKLNFLHNLIMVRDTILKPGANTFLTPILFAYRTKIFIFALRRSVSELVLGGQSATKLFSIIFKCEFLIFGGNFHLFFSFKNFNF